MAPPAPYPRKHSKNIKLFAICCTFSPLEFLFFAGIAQSATIWTTRIFDRWLHSSYRAVCCTYSYNYLKKRQQWTELLFGNTRRRIEARSLGTCEVIRTPNANSITSNYFDESRTVHTHFRLQRHFQLMSYFYTRSSLDNFFRINRATRLRKFSNLVVQKGKSRQYYPTIRATVYGKSVFS